MNRYARTFIRLVLIAVVGLTTAGVAGCACGDDDDDEGDDDSTDDDADDDTDDDSDDDASGVDHLEMEVSGSPAPADGSTEVTVTVRALDAGGNLVAGAVLDRFYVQAGFSTNELEYNDPGDGTFTVSMPSIAAIDYNFHASDSAGNSADGTAVFTPGDPDHLDVWLPSEQINDSNEFEGMATIIVRDAFENPVPLDPSELDVSADTGTVGDVTADPDYPYFTVPVGGTDWGQGTLTIELTGAKADPVDTIVRRPPGNLSNLPATAPIELVALNLQSGPLPGGLSGGLWPVTVEFNVPQSGPALKNFEGLIKFPPTGLQYIHYTDNADDSCVIDFVTPNEGQVYFGGHCNPPAPGHFEPIEIEFQPLSLTSAGEISFADMRLYSPLDDRFEPEDFMATWGPELTWPFKFKESRTIHVHIWVAPGHATEDAIQADIDQANSDLALNALLCSCDYFYTVEAEITELTEDQWKGIAGDDGQVDVDDRTDANNANDGDTRDDDQYNVYYGSVEEDGTYGVTNHNSDSAFVDSADDPDNRTFGHELGHLVSGDINDSDDDPDGQGANDEKNLYNYGDTGGLMTHDQCGQFPANPK